jgi:hypothetical protein
MEINPKQLKAIWLGIAFLIAGLTGYYAGLDSVSIVTQQALFTATEPFVAEVQTKSSGCVIQGSFPDPACTPGAIFANVTKEMTCVSGYTKTVRSVSTSLKKKVYQEYGIAYPPPFGTYEADHFIPLTLGGSNDIANLFPESAEPKPGFKEKDLVENYLHQKVCDGSISLSAAQRAIATDWVAVYNSISPTDMNALRQLYKSWSGTGD